MLNFLVKICLKFVLSYQSYFPFSSFSLSSTFIWRHFEYLGCNGHTFTNSIIHHIHQIFNSATELPCNYDHQHDHHHCWAAVFEISSGFYTFPLFLIFDTFLSGENWALTEIWIFTTFSKQREILNLFWGLVLARDIKLMSPDLDSLIYHQNLETPSKIGFSSKLEIKIRIQICQQMFNLNTAQLQWHVTFICH